MQFFLNSPTLLITIKKINKKSTTTLSKKLHFNNNNYKFNKQNFYNNNKSNIYLLTLKNIENSFVIINLLQLRIFLFK